MSHPIDTAAITTGVLSVFYGAKKIWEMFKDISGPSDNEESIAIQSLNIARDTNKRLNRIESRLQKCEKDRKALHEQIDLLRTTVQPTGETNETGNPPLPA